MTDDPLTLLLAILMVIVFIGMDILLIMMRPRTSRKIDPHELRETRKR